MSAIIPDIPFVAPWQSQWQRYSTQIVPLAGSTSGSRSLMAPAGQWWHPIYLEGRVTTSSASGDRVMELQITPGGGQTPYLQPATVPQAPSVFCRYVFAPGISSYSDTSLASFSWGVQAIPDMMWPPLTTFALVLNSADGSDAWSTASAMAYEVYTEDYDSGTLVPAPTPLLA